LIVYFKKEMALLSLFFIVCGVKIQQKTLKFKLISFKKIAVFLYFSH